MSEIIGCYPRCTARAREDMRFNEDSVARPAQFRASLRGGRRSRVRSTHVYKVDFNRGLVTIMRHRNGARHSLPR